MGHQRSARRAAVPTLAVFVLVLAAVHGRLAAAAGRNATDGTADGVLEVWLVPHTHADTGWMLTMQQYYDQLVEPILSTTLHALSQDKSRRCAMPAAFYFQYLRGICAVRLARSLHWRLALCPLAQRPCARGPQPALWPGAGLPSRVDEQPPRSLNGVPTAAQVRVGRGRIPRALVGRAEHDHQGHGACPRAVRPARVCRGRVVPGRRARGGRRRARREPRARVRAARLDTVHLMFHPPR